MKIKQDEHSEFATVTANNVATSKLLGIPVDRLYKFCALVDESASRAVKVVEITGQRFQSDSSVFVRQCRVVKRHECGPGFERMTKEPTASAPSAMKIKVVSLQMEYLHCWRHTRPLRGSVVPVRHCRRQNAPAARKCCCCRRSTSSWTGVLFHQTFPLRPFCQASGVKRRVGGQDRETAGPTLRGAAGGRTLQEGPN